MRNNTITTLLLIAIGMSTISACNGLLDSSNSQPNPISWQEGTEIIKGSEENLSEKEQQAYRADAEKLAIRYINNADSTQTTIPDKLIGNLYNGLIHIATSPNSKAKEVSEEYEIHARIPSHSRQVIVYVDTTTAWVDAWQEGNTETGNENVDELTNTYNLELVEYTALESTPNAIVKLQADRAFNVFAVGRKFRQLEDIENAGSEGITDGNEINVLFFGSHLRYYFELGFGDCPAGCINRHTWIFDVYRDGKVEYMGEKGDALE